MLTPATDSFDNKHTQNTNNKERYGKIVLTGTPACCTPTIEFDDNKSGSSCCSPSASSYWL